MKLRTKNYDAAGMTVGRVLRQHVLGKTRPLWNFGYELRVNHILALALRHYLGYPIAYLTTRFHPQWQRVLSQWRRIQHHTQGNKNDMDKS